MTPQIAFETMTVKQAKSILAPTQSKYANLIKSVRDGKAVRVAKEQCSVPVNAERTGIHNTLKRLGVNATVRQHDNSIYVLPGKVRA